MEQKKGPRKKPTSETRGSSVQGAGGRSLMTVLFTDIVDSTARAAQLGDRAWHRLLDQHDSLVRAEFARSGGNEIDTSGDGFLATFETPATAIACAIAVLDDVDELGLALRAGIHTGECEQRGKGVAGIAVHIAARVAAMASAGEVLVSSTVRDLAAGGEFEFTSRGAHALKGVPGRIRLFTASPARPKDQLPAKKAAARSSRRTPRSAPAMDQISVLIVDDHPLWRQTIRTLIERSGVAQRVFEASDGAEAIQAVKGEKLDVVIMDMALPGVHGLDATREITQASPQTRVLVLSSSDEEEQVMEAVQAGAAGYLLKTAGPTEILEGLRRVHSGELVFPPSLAKLVLAELRGGGAGRASAGPLTRLTEREIEVLARMAEGHTNEAVGKALYMSPKTVEAHVTSIFSKLGLDPGSGGHRRVLAVIAYLTSVRSRKNPQRD